MGSVTDPDPMTPADCDLRDFAYMPLDVLRLRDSGAAALANPEAFRACVLAWCASWHQVPAASLPDDDAALSVLLGYGRTVAAWSKVRKAGGLHGWVKCSDGRLYHPVVADKAREAWKVALRLRGRFVRRLEMESGVWDDLRRAVFLRDDHTCRYCLKRGVRLECDHVIPISRGGGSNLGNLVTACKPCNRSKGARTPQEWMQ